MSSTLKHVLQQWPKGPSQPRTQSIAGLRRPNALSPKSKAKPISLYVANATHKTGPRQLACLRKMTSGVHKHAKSARSPALRQVAKIPPSSGNSHSPPAPPCAKARWRSPPESADRRRRPEQAHPVTMHAKRRSCRILTASNLSFFDCG